MATYERVVDGVSGKYVVLQVVPSEESRVVAVCDTPTRATQVAALLTADEA